MALMRSALLRGARSPWLAHRARKSPFVRRAVRRFVPGESLDDALLAAVALQGQGLGSVLTRLGEDVLSPGQAAEVTKHYVMVLDKIEADGLDAQVSVKPTQVGLELSQELCFRNLSTIVDRAARADHVVTLDMESTRHTDATLDLFRRLRRDYSNVGICLQSYLFRTTKDLGSLLALGPTVRLVKGAYDEPRELAIARKRDVNDNFLALVRQLSSSETARQAGARLVLGSHDINLVRHAMRLAIASGLPLDAVEVHMLYGIQRAEQARLAAEGVCVRVLISYGDAWFAWYMRRLAERPANLLFVLQQVVAG